MAQHHLSNHWNRATATRPRATFATGLDVPGHAAAVRPAPRGGAQELFELQLLLRAPLPEARLHAVLDVLPAHQVAAEAARARRHVQRDGRVDRLGDYAATTGPPICSAARATR